MSFVYLLVSTSGSTYIGATINLEHRLRQHNKEIKGGAKATSIKVEQGEHWERAAYVSGFPDWQAALQFEWRWKQLSRKLPMKILPLKRRLIALNQLINLEKSTSKAIPYSEWETLPEILFSNENIHILYDEN
jgi:structure-specific endonuclease subunit SLX1